MFFLLFTSKEIFTTWQLIIMIQLFVIIGANDANNNK